MQIASGNKSKCLPTLLPSMLSDKPFWKNVECTLHTNRADLDQTTDAQADIGLLCLHTCLEELTYLHVNDYFLSGSAVGGGQEQMIPLSSTVGECMI